MIKNLIKGDNIEENLASILLEFHLHGPINSLSLEKLAYYKKYHPARFARFENKLLYSMGLFYKSNPSHSMLEEVYSIYAQSITIDTGRCFTPVQSGIYNSIIKSKYYSFSAPTSAGKSFLFRELIQNTENDIVIVVPSRALISEYFSEVLSLVGKDVLVLQFVENVNLDLVSRRIFIITPERSAQLFDPKNNFSIDFFLLDEAQLSEEELRGMRFDAFVRRIDRAFPESKKIFAHPFVSNPEAQLLKHNFNKKAYSHSYNQQSVGKIFIQFENDSFNFFSPNIVCPTVPMNVDIAEEVLSNNGTMLVYIAKRKIYDGSYRITFGKYVDMCQKLEDKNALGIIHKLREFIGAKEGASDKHSNFIELMERGIVTHHGSMPLKARLIVEQFIKEGLAKICFATSTLNQGINMPFDVVWIDNYHNVKELTLKNLIGRAGRTSSKSNGFDYGYTIVKKENVSSFSLRYKETYKLSTSSRLDLENENIDGDMIDLVEAVKSNSFDDELRLPTSQVERISKAKIDNSIAYILDRVIPDSVPITGNEYYKIPNAERTKVKTCFKNIYLKHLRRKALEPAESSVLSAAIPIMLWHIQGRSFSEIISLRHSFLTQKSEQGRIKAKLKRKEITDREASGLWRNLTIRFSQAPSPLPNKRCSRASSFPFPDKHIDELDYDSLVYDTYDYLDKVVSLSLTDPLCAALELYHKKHGDRRAKALSNYIRFGTNDETDMWLMKYGFGFEDIDWIKEHIESVDQNRIHFKESIYSIPLEKMEVVERFI